MFGVFSPENCVYKFRHWKGGWGQQCANVNLRTGHWIHPNSFPDPMVLLLVDVLVFNGIFGHQFVKRLESFAPCYSQSFYWRIFKENQTILWF
jgi:hypothetical protein